MTKYLLKSISQVIRDFFTTDMDVISNECKKTLANPVSRAGYRKCINEIRERNLTESNFVDYDGKVKTITRL